MSRYIDADALCQDLMQRWHTAEKEKEKLIQAVMADIVTPIVAIQSTADVRENVHGEWLVDKYNAEFCSVCGKHPYNDGEYYVVGWYSDFCPNCGADMRKGETNG